MDRSTERQEKDLLGATPRRSPVHVPEAADVAPHVAPTFTPGPWVARQRPAETERAYLAGVDLSAQRGDRWSIDAEDEWFELATVYASGGEFCERSEANAHLIAAAPDLYGALKLLDERGWTTATWDIAKRALAKAEGRERQPSRVGEASGSVPSEAQKP